jgi:hypothetical protein
MMNERRNRRSEVAGVAATYYLEAVASRAGHEAVVLSDGDGLLLADTGGRAACEAMAAVAPLAGDARIDVDGLLGLVTRGRPLHVWPVEMQGERYYLAAVGGRPQAPKGAQVTLNRIFA